MTPTRSKANGGDKSPPARFEDLALSTLNLSSMAGGAAGTLFENALDQVLNNLVDENTDWKAKRRITLAITFMTNEDRRMGAVTVACATKLAGIKPVPTFVRLSRRKGVMVAIEDPTQEELFPKSDRRERPVEDEGAEPR